MHRYTVFSVDSSRRAYTDHIRRTLKDSQWCELYTRCINARRYDDLEKELHRRDIAVNNDSLTRGEVAIWMTVLNGIENAPVVTLEDDAIIDSNFTDRFETALAELPDDADFFSLFIPRDSDHMFTTEYDLNSTRVCRAYQGYGGVSMYITMRGAANIRQLVHRDGITDQWDNQLYAYSKAGILNGYTSMPSTDDIVWISGEEPTTVHDTERFESAGINP